MSRSGEEMILELATLLGTKTVKTAAKKDDKDDNKDDKDDKDEKKDDKDDKKDDKDEKKDDKKDEKEDKEKKEASIMLGVVQDLVKLAGELDEIGADEASILVDDALKVIVESIKATEEE